jgi:hypothetical protein
MSIYKIYALKEVSSNEIKYIGLTTKSLNERLGRHLRDKKIDHKTNWIKKIGRENIEIILLDDSTFNGDTNRLQGITVNTITVTE